MEKIALGRKSTAWQRSRVDRFVRSRYSFEELCRHRRLDENVPIDIWSTRYRQRKIYLSHLHGALGLQPRREIDDIPDPLWPCEPRRKSFLSPADSVLDLPSYKWAVFPELVDWSCKNLMVAALGRNYHMFGWRSQQVIGKGLTTHQIQCCKFDPRGDLLLIGTAMKTVELHCNMWKLWTSAGHCRCTDGINNYCSITAVDWSPTGNSYVTGCSRGVVSSFDRSSIFISTYNNSKRDAVLLVRVSPDTRFVAIMKLMCPSVEVLVWPSLEYHSSINCNMNVKTMSWHPWRPALLVMGGVADVRSVVVVWDPPSSRLEERSLFTLSSLDLILFSGLTGEMVLSLCNSDVESTYPNISQLIVMRDPYTVVDQSGDQRGGLDRIKTMVFSPDGTKLATATAAEDLIIWNFLPENQKKDNLARRRRFSAIPVYYELVTKGFVLR